MGGEGAVPGKTREEQVAEVEGLRAKMGLGQWAGAKTVLKMARRRGVLEEGEGGRSERRHSEMQALQKVIPPHTHRMHTGVHTAMHTGVHTAMHTGVQLPPPGEGTAGQSRPAPHGKRSVVACRRVSHARRTPTRECGVTQSRTASASAIECSRLLPLSNILC